MERLAAYWASTISAKLNLSQVDQEIIAYSISYILIVLINLSLLIIFGLLAGVLLPTLSAAFSSGLFRVFTGGAHFGSAGVCAVISSLAMLACALLGQTASNINLGWNALFMVVTFVNLGLSIWLYAPVAAAGRPITDQERQRFRRISLSLLPAWLVLVGYWIQRFPASAIASLLAANWQAMTLTPVGQRVYGFIDRTVCLVLQNLRRFAA